MKKQSTIRNLLVVPLIASAVLLANPALADNPGTHLPHSEIRHKTSGNGLRGPQGIVGVVTSINGEIIVVTTESGVQYTVDATNATIMKASGLPNTNPSIVTISDIKVGDAIIVRGVINDKEIAAERIVERKTSSHHKFPRG